jgi:hypothetical protein
LRQSMLRILRNLQPSSVTRQFRQFSTNPTAMAPLKIGFVPGKFLYIS